MLIILAGPPPLPGVDDDNDYFYNKIIVKRNQIKRQQQGELLISGPTSAAARGNTLISWKLAGEQYKERFVNKIRKLFDIFSLILHLALRFVSLLQLRFVPLILVDQLA